MSERRLAWKPRSLDRFAWVIGLVLASLLMIGVFLFADVYYTVNDDAGILRFFIGYQPGGPSNFCLCFQAPVSSLLYGLSSLFPGVAWFSVMQFFLLWLANAVIFKSLMQCFIRQGRSLWAGLAVSLLFFAQFSLYTIARVTFTVTSAMLGAAAVAQMMSIGVQAVTPRRYVLRSLPAIGMLAFAYALRNLAALPAYVFFSIVIAGHALTLWGLGRRTLRGLRPLGITLLAAVVALGGMVGAYTWEISAKGQDAYMAWSQARFKATDYLSFSQISDDVYAQVGWSQSEVKMLENWYTMDADYTTQAFETVVRLSGRSVQTSAGAAIYALSTHFPLIVLSFVLLLCQGMACLLWLRWFHRGEALRPALVLMATGMLCFLMFSYLALQGRLPVRAAQAPVLPAAVIVFCLIPECLPRKGSLTGWRRRALPVTLALLITATLAVAVPTAYNLRKIPSPWNYNTYDDMDVQALSHPDQLWVYDIDLVNDTRIFPDVSKGIPTNLMFWGGWESGSKEYLARLAAFGIDDEHFSAEDWLNPAMRFLSVKEEPNELLLDYLREQTGKDVRFERERLSAGLYGYRFYVAQ